MSSRHREGTTALRKEERLAEHRRDRRAARQLIPVAEPDAAVLPGEGPAHLHAHRPSVRATAPARHWKLPFWKRRHAVRVERALAERRVADEI